jgi:hypothetical protein
MSFVSVAAIFYTYPYYHTYPYYDADMENPCLRESDDKFLAPTVGVVGLPPRNQYAGQQPTIVCCSKVGRLLNPAKTTRTSS